MTRPAYMPDHDELVRQLQVWSASQDPHRAAAADLLIRHGYWLRRSDMLMDCVRLGGGVAWLDFDALADYAAREGYSASTSEDAILRFAVALGRDVYRLTIMGADNSQLIAEAVSTALGGVQIGPGGEDLLPFDQLPDGYPR